MLIDAVQDNIYSAVFFCFFEAGACSHICHDLNRGIRTLYTAGDRTADQTKTDKTKC